ncbi:MAG: aminodeoxychorismate synthase component I [Actinomycetota bacterium]
MIEARFDDLGPTPRSFRLEEPVGVIEAHRPDEVRDALAAVEAATARGLWAGGFVSYEAAPGFDRALVVASRPPGDPFTELPLLWFALFDRVEPTELPEGPDVDEPDGSADALGQTWVPSIDRARFDASVGSIQERIEAGDTYQVNYTLRLRAGLAGDERGLYRDLCLAQRGAYGAYLNLGRYRIVSASPELFFRIEDGPEGERIVTRPMKGTAARGRWAEEDLEAASRLGASAKDRAENAMIVDLVRNDLGRIARPGSVTVPDLFTTERYETVWQMTSRIEADLEPGTSVTDVFGALFPSGSVTGAPKIATMELIAALEDSPRGVYCGAVGLLAPPGSREPRAVFNVAIRTVMLDTRTGTAEYGVGGGITHDSRAAAEYDEVLAKARVLAVRRPPFDLIETMRRHPGGGVHGFERHLRRLSSSAAYFGFAFDESRVREAIEAATVGVDEAVRVRLLLARDGTVTTESMPMVPPRTEPVRIAIDDVAVPVDDALLFHKTTRRSRFEEARARHPEAEDVLLVNGRGQITESTIANVAVRIDGIWYTPPLGAGCLPGTRRSELLEDGTLHERAIMVDEARGAQEIALINATRGWRPAVLIDA